ncbi:MAG: folylpolyglutamate synthase/dihydrofolate synthase family protein [Pseudomonadota bacterium]
MTPASDAVLDRMMALHPKDIDLTLERMWGCLGRLGNPHRSLAPVIHIAGTNGKGSTQAMIRAGLVAAGQRVQAYTSPHLARFHERIRLSDGLISEDALVPLLERVLAENAGHPITYFEITTAAALLAFAEDAADYTLLEVGLGGRLDATNVVDAPRLSIITTIDYDHQAYLGDTLTEIAGEKAGIIKPDVPVVVGVQQDDALEVIEREAMRQGAPLLVHGQHWHARSEAGRLIVEDETGLVDLPLPNLRGQHQISNAGTAVVALRQLGFDGETLEAAVTGAKWPGRMQELDVSAHVPGPMRVFLDVGHNPHAAAGAAAYLRTLKQADMQVILCLGMLNTRDIGPVLAAFGDLFDTGVAVDMSRLKLGYGADEIAAGMTAAGLATSTTEDILAGLAAARDPARPALALIFGSFFMAELLNERLPIPGLDGL